MFAKSQSKYMLKTFLWNLARPRPTPPSGRCFLFATRRGGSTLLAQTLATIPSSRLIDQPLSHTTLPPFFNKIVPLREQSIFADLSPRDEKMLISYFDDILNGRLFFSSPCRIWERQYWTPTDRIVLKILNANSLLPWFVENFQGHFLYLIRHPFPQALSVLNRNWTDYSISYLRNLSFREKWLGSEGVEICERTLAEKDPFLWGVLNWGLENLIPHRMRQMLKTKVTYLNYEETVAWKNDVIVSLGQMFGLAPESRTSQAMRKCLDTATKTARSTNPEGVDISTRKLTAWRAKLSSEQQDKAWSILNGLGIDSYQPSRHFPSKDFCLLPDHVSGAFST